MASTTSDVEAAPTTSGVTGTADSEPDHSASEVTFGGGDASASSVVAVEDGAITA
jgi:hypothetical protein